MHALIYFLLPQLIAAAAFRPRSHQKRAAYFLDNNPAGASIVSLAISPDDGTLSNPVRTSTKGNGMFGLAAPATGSGPSVPGTDDTLFTQDSVVVSENYLFTVNAGSNTAVMFSIDENDPYHPCMVGSPVNSLGTFPASIAYSNKLRTACVLNGGTVPGIACFSVHNTKGLTPLGGLRSVALNKTDPPKGPFGTVSDISFNPSQTALIATVKGTPPTRGSVYAYPVSWDGSISTTPVISSPAGLIVDFSISFLGDDSKAVLSDPAYGASIVTISPSLEVSVAEKIIIPGQGAICWSEHSSTYDAIYLMDAGVSNVTVLDPRTGAIKGTIVQSESTKGSVDAALDREWLYVLKATSSISVIGNLGNLGEEVQAFDLSSLGSRQGFSGLAIYPSSNGLWW